MQPMSTRIPSLPLINEDSRGEYVWIWMVPFVLATVLVVVSQINFLLFHTLAEFFAIIVAILMSVVAWQMYPFTRNNYLMYLGCAYFWIGVLDLAHALTYKGMNVIPFTTASGDIAIQFWITTRMLEGLVLLTAPWFLQKSLNRVAVFIGFGIIALFIGLLITADVMPEAFNEQTGLTPFKVYSEFSVMAIIVLAVYLLLRKKQLLDKKIIYLIVASMLLTICAEVAFTQYVSLYGFSNLVGHIFKLFSYWLIFYAVIRTTLHEPFLAMARTATSYDAIPDATIVVDNDGIIREVNQKALKITNLSVDNIVGSHCHPFFHPLNLDEHECPVCAHIKLAQPIENLELDFGENHQWRDYSLSPVKSELFSHGMVQVIRDVTQRKHAQQQLSFNLRVSQAMSRALTDYISDEASARRNFEQMLQDILQITESKYGLIGEVHIRENSDPYLLVLAITDISWSDKSKKLYEAYTDRGMKFENLNTVFGRIMLSGEPLISNDMKHFPRSSDFPEGHPPLNTFMGLPLKRGGKLLGVVAVANSSSGYDEECLNKTEPFLQTCASVIGAHQDAKIRESYQIELQRTKDYLQAMYQASPDMIFLFADDGTLLDVNDSVIKSYGYTREELFSLSPEALTDEQHNADDFAVLIKAAQAGDVVDFEWVARRKSGEVFPVEVRLRRLSYGEDANNVLAAVTDISRRKAAENELRRHRDHLQDLVAERTRELEMSNKELESYSYSIAHDLRAPLRSITSFGQILREDAEARLLPNELDSLNRIINAGKSMAELIDDILELSRISRTEISITSVNISRIAQSIFTKLHTQNPQMDVRFNVQEDMVTQGDPRLVAVALDNLISNAWKYSSKKSDSLISLGSKESQDRKVFYVQDNGVGFDMRYADKLYKPFHRLHRNDEFEGTGVGLATVQRIVHRHGGSLWAESQPGKGATFYFYFA